MTHDEFFKAIKRGEIARAYLFQGEEEYIKGKALEAVRKKLLPEGLEALNETILSNPPAMDLIAAAETLPMMADRRLVLVRELSALLPAKPGDESEGTDRLVAYISRLPETACIIFYVVGYPDGRKKLTLALKKHTETVTFGKLTDTELTRWIQTQCARHQKTIGREHAVYLAFVTGRELMTLAQEIAKLAGYMGERSEATRADIDAVIAPTLECTIFQMVDALVEGRTTEAFQLLSVLLDHGEKHIGILAMLARQYSNLLHLQRLKPTGIRDRDLAARIGVPLFVVTRLTAQARHINERTLRECLDLCVDTDYAIKSGRMENETALERAMLLLAGKAAGE